MTNYVNPYLNPYGQQYQPYQSQIQPQLQQQQVTKVNGENGAKAYNMAPNSSALLLDECGTIVWLKVTDGAGFPTITPYDVTPHQPTPQPDYSTLETRIARLEELVNGNTANPSATRRKQATKPTDADIAPTD